MSRFENKFLYTLEFTKNDFIILRVVGKIKSDDHGKDGEWDQFIFINEIES